MAEKEKKKSPQVTFWKVTVAEGAPVVSQQKQIQLVSMRMRVQSLASLSELRIRCCRELWCRLEMQLGSQVAVALV